MIRLIEPEDLDNLVVDIRNFQDSALLASIYCGLSKKEISDLTIDQVDEVNHVVLLEDRQVKVNELVDDLDVIGLLVLAHKQKRYIDNNGIPVDGETIIRHQLDVNDKRVFKGIDDNSIDDKLKIIDTMFDAEGSLTYENLRASGEMARIFSKKPLGESLHFDKDGNPISVMRWANLCEDVEYRTIRQETVGEYDVSTIWTGLDMGVSIFKDKDYKPLVFETMVFSGVSAVELVRASSEEKAIENHERLVNKFKNKN